MSNFLHQTVAFPTRHALAPSASAALHSLEALLAVRQDVVFRLERHRASAAGSPSSSSSSAHLDAEVALLAASAERLAADIERLLARLEAILPPDGPTRS